MVGEHTRPCAVSNNISNIDTYLWEGKLDRKGRVNDRPVEEVSSGIDVTEKNCTARLIDVKEDMGMLADELATGVEGRTMTPLQVWLAVKKVMDEKHGSYIGHNRQYIVDRVHRSRKEMDFGDKFRAVECLHNVMSDSDHPFLHYHASFPDRSNPKELMRLMVFANPTLIPLLKSKKLDIFVDATFDCCPAPFYQCLIVMVFDDQTGLYVPVVYILMTHKNDELYWEAIARIPVLVDFKLDCHSFTSDFERALINNLKRHLDTAQHVGCYFHLKQAWWKYMRDVLKKMR